MDKIIWYFKQLLPLAYHTVYKEAEKWHYTKWRMWFGRCFAIRDEVLN